MKKPLSIILIITVLMLLYTVPAKAYVVYNEENIQSFAESGRCGKNATWTYDKETRTVTIDGIGEIYNYGTLENGQSPFYYNRLFNTVVINEGITRIGNLAFCGASISSLQLPESLISIGKYALENTKIDTLNIPKNVRKIEIVSGDGISLFDLKSINVSEENQYYSSKDGVLYNKLGTSLIVYPINKKTEKFIVPSGVKTINRNACTHSKFTSIEFPNSLEKINSGAFFNSQLKNIDKYSKNLKSIGKNAFTWTNIEKFKINKKLTKIRKNDFLWCEKLEKITVNKNNEIYSSKNGVLFSKDKKNLILFPRNKKVDVYIVPNGVKTIENNAFSYSKIKAVKLPNSLTTFEKKAFYNSSLKKIEKYSSNLKTVGKFAFAYTNIKEFRIGKKVENLYNSALNSCEMLKKITVNKNNNKFCSANGVLLSKNKKSLLVYPDGKKGDYVIPNSVERISSYAFECSKLTKITISKNIKTISKRAFAHAEDLEKVVFERNKLPKILTGAFNKAYDDGMWPTVIETKFYVKNKSLKKELKTKLEESGLIEFKIIVKD